MIRVERFVHLSREDVFKAAPYLIVPSMRATASKLLTGCGSP